MPSLPSNTRLIYFLFGCIPVRIVYAFIQNHKWIQQTFPYFIYINLLISIGFLMQYLKWTPETRGGFGGKVWWNDLRLLHSILFVIAIWYPMILYIDVGIGTVATLFKYLF
jgi:hypothetical protein